MPLHQSFIHRAGAWLLHSGIQESGGGVARYYRSDIESNQPVSTEITGYAVSAFVYLQRVTGDSVYGDAALRSARFLTRTAWDAECRTFPFELAPFELAPSGDPPRRLAYFFDCGIIARGLLAVWRAGGGEEFLESARLCGRSMASDFLRDGVIRPILALPGKEPLADGESWSRRPGCYQLKSAMAWNDLHLAAGGEETRCLYERALGEALRSHGSFLPGVENKERVMDRLHAYCYFLEALLPRADRPECAAALQEGIERTAFYLRDIAPAFERSDVSAQLLRLRLYAAALGAVPLDEQPAEEESIRAAGFQVTDPDPRIDGGFCFGRRQGEMLPFINPVSTAFCLQALQMWRQWQDGEFRPDLSLLI